MLLFLWRVLSDTRGNHVIYYLGQPNLDVRIRQQTYYYIIILITK